MVIENIFKTRKIRRSPEISREMVRKIWRSSEISGEMVRLYLFLEHFLF